MADFADCLATGPEFGEVGYVGDYPQPLEYPCDCWYCRGESEGTGDQDAKRSSTTSGPGRFLPVIGDAATPAGVDSPAQGWRSDD